MKDRSMQMLYKLALDPIAETLADTSSFGFRKFRGTHDAMEYAFTLLSRRYSPQWVLEGDIKGCFDNISHQWLMENVQMDKNILQAFLKAGFIYQKELFPTINGTPQGGLCKASHNPPYAKKVIMQSKPLKCCIFNGF